MVLDFLKQYPSFWNRNESVFLQLAKVVKKQAINHTRRSDNDELLTTARPNEQPDILQYRKDNKRNLTKGVFDEFVSTVSRIYTNSGLHINDSELSEPTKEWLNSKPFEVLNQRYNLIDFYFGCALGLSLESPADAFVMFPVGTVDGVPPALPLSEGGTNPNQRIELETKLLEVEDIRIVEKGVFGWSAGYLELETPQGGKRSFEYFYLTDEDVMYRYYPNSLDKNNQPVYVLEIWYEHNCGFIPVKFLGGRLCKAGESVYLESMMHSAFEYGDEFINAFSDNQAVRLMHNFPKQVMLEIPCPTCEGKGHINERGEDGRFVMKSGVPVKNQCSKCHGSKIIKNPGVFDVLIRPGATGLDKNVYSGDVLQFVSPPTENIKLSYDTAFDLLKKMRQQLGLDLFSDESESGIAKGMRLQKLDDILADIATKNIKPFIDFVLMTAEAYFEPTPSKRKQAFLAIPKSYNIKTPQMLRDEAENAISSEKIDAQLAYLKAKYENEPEKLQVYELYYAYTPFSVLEFSEIQPLMDSGYYDDFEIHKKGHGMLAFTTLQKQGKLTDDIFKNFELADDLIRGIVPEKVLIRDDNGNNITEV